MKKLSQILVLSVLLFSLIPLTLVGAQDGTDDVALNSVEPTAVYYLSAASGSFADNGDGTYTLTLDGVGEELLWLGMQPSLSVNPISNINFNQQWGVSEGLATEAVLEIGGVNVMMSLTSPAYSDGVQTFIAVVEEVVDPAAKEPELPMEFGAANLTIAWSLEFQTGLVDGMVAVFEGLRATPEECQSAIDKYNAYQSWKNQKVGEMTQYMAGCFAMADSNSCTSYYTIENEINARSTEIGALQTYLNTECSWQ